MPTTHEMLEERIRALIADRDLLRSKGERMATAAREVVRDIDALAAQGLIRCAPYSADVTLRAALAEWEGPCGTCGGSEIAKFGNGPAFDTLCSDCTKGGA